MIKDTKFHATLQADSCGTDAQIEAAYHKNGEMNVDHSTTNLLNDRAETLQKLRNVRAAMQEAYCAQNVAVEKTPSSSPEAVLLSLGFRDMIEAQDGVIEAYLQQIDARNVFEQKAEALVRAVKAEPESEEGCLTEMNAAFRCARAVMKEWQGKVFALLAVQEDILEMFKVIGGADEAIRRAGASGHDKVVG
jgi:hypothetical protein